MPTCTLCGKGWGLGAMKGFVRGNAANGGWCHRLATGGVVVVVVVVVVLVALVVVVVVAAVAQPRGNLDRSANFRQFLLGPPIPPRDVEPSDAARRTFARSIVAAQRKAT